MWNPFKQKNKKEIKQPIICSFSIEIGSYKYKANGYSVQECSNEIQKFHSKIKTVPIDYIG